MKAITTSADLGAAIGAAHAGMAQSAVAVHRVFVKALPEVQRDMRRDFKVNYVWAYSKRHGTACTHEQATTAVDAGKRKAGALADAVNAASSACTLYLANGGNKDAKVHQTATVVVPRALKAQVKALLETYTAAQIKAALK